MTRAAERCKDGLRPRPLEPGSALRQVPAFGGMTNFAKVCHPVRGAAFFTVRRRHGTQGLNLNPTPPHPRAASSPRASAAAP